MKIDSTTSEGKEKLTKLLINAIMNDDGDKLELSSVVKKTAYKAYEEALVTLSELKGKGLCDFKYDSIFEPFYMHGVFVSWKGNADKFFETDTETIVDLVSKFDRISLDGQEPLTWFLSIKIYYEESEIEC